VEFGLEVWGATSLLHPPLPFLSPSLPPLSLLSLPSLSLEVGPLNPARGSGGAL